MQGTCRDLVTERESDDPRSPSLSILLSTRSPPNSGAAPVLHWLSPEDRGSGHGKKGKRHPPVLGEAEAGGLQLGETSSQNKNQKRGRAAAQWEGSGFQSQHSEEKGCEEWGRGPKVSVSGSCQHLGEVRGTMALDSPHWEQARCLMPHFAGSHVPCCLLDADDVGGLRCRDDRGGQRTNKINQQITEQLGELPGRLARRNGGTCGGRVTQGEGSGETAGAKALRLALASSLFLMTEARGPLACPSISEGRIFSPGTQKHFLFFFFFS